MEDLARTGFPSRPDWLERDVRNGKCIIMLDGLDEVGDANFRKEVASWIEKQITAYPHNRFIVTSRPFGYSANPVVGLTVLAICPFAFDQVKSFVHNWYLTNEIMSAQKDDAGVRMGARSQADNLIERLRKTPALFDLAINPLLLTMITTIHRYRSSLPERRVELYDEICDVFLGKRQEARGMAYDLTPAQKKLALQPLAFSMMLTKHRDLEISEAVEVLAGPLAAISPLSSVADFLKMIENTSGIIIERETGIYSFAHLTFQEYLAAVHVQSSGCIADLLEHLDNSWWHETIRLYCAVADATPVVRRCLDTTRPSVPFLVLAIECMEMARQLDVDQRARLDSLLTDGLDDYDRDRRRIATEAFLNLRLRRMLPLDETTLLDETAITNSEYQLFLDDLRVKRQYCQPDHWAGLGFTKGTGKYPVTGVRRTDALLFCEWLTTKSDSGRRYRPPQEAELKADQRVIKLADGSKIPFWMMDTSERVITSLSHELEGTGFEWADIVGRITSDSEAVCNTVNPELQRRARELRPLFETLQGGCYQEASVLISRYTQPSRA